MSFADVRAMGKDGQTVEINDYLIVEGYVVSNQASGNVGENEKLSLTASDNTSYKKKFYLESLDGNYGFLASGVRISVYAAAFGVAHEPRIFRNHALARGQCICVIERCQCPFTYGELTVFQRNISIDISIRELGDKFFALRQIA